MLNITFLKTKEFGSELIGKNSSLESEVQSLQNRVEARNQEMEQLYHQLAEYKADLELNKQFSQVS